MVMDGKIELQLLLVTGVRHLIHQVDLVLMKTEQLLTHMTEQYGMVFSLSTLVQDGNIRHMTIYKISL